MYIQVIFHYARKLITVRTLIHQSKISLKVLNTCTYFNFLLESNDLTPKDRSQTIISSSTRKRSVIFSLQRQQRNARVIETQCASLSYTKERKK